MCSIGRSGVQLAVRQCGRGFNTEHTDASSVLARRGGEQSADGRRRNGCGRAQRDDNDNDKDELVDWNDLDLVGSITLATIQ